MDQTAIQQRIVTPILERRQVFDTADSYYEGTQTERFLSNRFYNDFGSYNSRTTLNFMRPVVDNTVNRLEINNIVGKKKGVNEKLEEIRTFNNAPLLEKEVHRGAGRLGEYYVMVWPDAETKQPVISHHDPRNTLIIFDPENPREKLCGARIWYDQILGGHKLMILWPDRIEKYATTADELSAGSTWTYLDTVVNPFGEVPLFLFTPQGRAQACYPTDVNRYQPYGRPEHFDGYSIQDAINKLTITHLTTVDYQGAPQRFALAHPGADGMEVEDFVEDETDREQQGLKNGPGELWYMKGIHTVGQFQPADPKVFLEPIDHNVRVLASTTNTPIHYFKETGNIPSGNALRAAEAPLLKKVTDRQMSYGVSWKEVYKFAIMIDTDKQQDVTVLWKSVESIDILEEWDVIAKKRNAGVPFRQAMKEAGYDDQTIEQMIEWKQQEQDELGNQFARNPGDLGGQTGKASNTNPEVRTNVNKDETKVGTGE